MVFSSCCFPTFFQNAPWSLPACFSPLPAHSSSFPPMLSLTPISQAQANETLLGSSAAAEALMGTSKAIKDLSYRQCTMKLESTSLGPTLPRFQQRPKLTSHILPHPCGLRFSRNCPEDAIGHDSAQPSSCYLALSSLPVMDGVGHLHFGCSQCSL